MPHTHSPSDLQIKTFQIHSSADEQSMNEFLAGKTVRHWAANFSPSNVWNVFVAYELRSESRADHRDGRQDGRNDRDRNDRDRNDRDGRGSRKNATQSGNRASANAPAKSDKAITEDYKPQIADSDFPLFDAVRKWRNTRAREARVKPYSFFNNRQLEQIVTAKPETADALHGIAVDMSGELWDKYHTELLSFLETARSSNDRSGSPVLESADSAVEAG